MPPALDQVEEAVQTNASPKPTSGILNSSATSTTSSWTPSSVLSTLPPDSRPTPHTTSPIPFFHLLARLKTTKREGWRRFGIAHGESIADHMYRMSMLTMLAPPSLLARGLDIARATKMALVHDMAESLVGDITPVDGVSKAEKSRREAATIDYLCGELLGQVDGGIAAEELRQVWLEYEEGKTLESVFVHDVDKMELVLQTVEYERAHQGRVDLGEFTWVAKRIVLPEIKAWCEQVLAERAELWKGYGKVPSGGRFEGDREAQQVEYYGNGARPENGHNNA